MPPSNPSEPAPADEEGTVALHARIARLEAALAEAAEREARARLELAALRGAENAFTTVFRHAPFGIVIGSLDDNLLRTNQAFEQITGYTGEEVARLTVRAITHPEDYIREVDLIMDLLEGRRTHYQIEKRYFHKDGRTVPVMVTGLVVCNDLGTPEACVALVEDLSERHRAEELRGYLAAILEIAPDLMGYQALDGTLQYLNRAWRRFRAIPDDADLGALEIGAWQPAWAARLTADVGIPAALAAGSWQGETVAYDAAGAEVPMRQSILALHDRDGQPARLAMVLHDLREARKATRQRIALERKLLEAQRLESIGVMAAGIAHDFNNILTTIIGNADFALLGPDLDQHTRHSLEAVLEGAHRAAELTRQILAYAGKGAVSLQPTDLNRTIQSLEELLRGSAGRRSRLQLDLDDPLPLVEADSAQLRQVLLNLVINAGEAIEAARPDGVITVRTSGAELVRHDLDGLIHGADLPAGPYVRLTVEDNGCGMDRGTLGRIFDPFFSTKFLGRGLGLAAVQGIVRTHLGALLVESAAGAGTRFSIWLPAWSETGEEQRGPEQRLDGRGSVLVVEPDPVAGERIAALLRRLGLHALPLSDGAAAIAQLSAGLPELAAAIVAHDTPELRPDMVVQAVESMRPGTPVLRLAPGGELQRPVTLEALRRAIATACGPAGATGQGGDA